LDIQGRVKSSGGYVSIPHSSGIGVEPETDFIKRFEISV